MTARLAAIAVDQWARLDGHAAAHGLPDLRTLPVERFANFVWYMSTKGLDVAGIEKLRSRLWLPPAGAPIDERSPWSAEAEEGAFKALKLSTQGRK